MGKGNYPVNRVKCKKVKAKCSFSMADTDMLMVKPSREYVDVFIHPSLKIQIIIVIEILQVFMQAMVTESAQKQ